MGGPIAMTRGYSRRFRQIVDLVAAFFGLLALLAQAIAPVCMIGGFAPPPANGGIPVIICTLHGSRTVSLDADGHPIAPKPDNGGDTQCPMCAAAHITPVLVPLAALLLILIFRDRADTFSVTSPRMWRRAYSPFITRAPPAAAEALQ